MEMSNLTQIRFGGIYVGCVCKLGRGVCNYTTPPATVLLFR